MIGSSKLLIWFLWISNDFISSDWQMLLLSYSVILPCSDWQVLLLFYSVILFCYSALLFSRRSEFGWNWCKLPSWSISAAIIIVAILIWKADEGCFQILCYQDCYHCNINLRSTSGVLYIVQFCDPAIIHLCSHFYCNIKLRDVLHCAILCASRHSSLQQ